MSELAEPKDEKKEGPDKWEVDQACETLMKADEIKKDKKLMALVEKKLKRKKEIILTSLADLKKLKYDKGVEAAEEEKEA